MSAYLDAVQQQMAASKHKPGFQSKRNEVAYNHFKQFFGRPPTQSEREKIYAAYQGPNGYVTGKAYVASLYDQYQQSPEYLKTKAPEQYGAVGNVMQDLLKRGASQSELDHFGKMLASGELDEFELRSFVQQLPEYRTAEDRNFRQGLNSELEGYDQQAFSRGKDDIISSYARSGIQHSPALDNALTDLMGKISQERSKYLAGISAQQYGGNKEAARQDYGATLDRYMGDRNYGRQRNDQMTDFLSQRGYAAQDYQTQRNDYLNYLNSQKSSNRGGMGQAFGPLAGMAIGGMIGGPAGATLGAQFGRAGGGAYDYLNY